MSMEPHGTASGHVLNVRGAESRATPIGNRGSRGIDHVLVIGFGGPTQPAQVRPFLEEVTHGLPIPRARIEEVAHHYEAVGGRSPYRDETVRLVEGLQVRLRDVGVALPVFVGMRYAQPRLVDVVCDIQRAGLSRGLGVILTAHRSEASFDRYLAAVASAISRLPAPAVGRLAGAHAGGLTYTYLGPWHDHPLFIEAQAALVEEALAQLDPVVHPAAHLLFTAHSIPVAMASVSRYAQEVETSSRAVAERLRWTRWSLAYQSRSGPPAQPWLEPDVQTALALLASRGVRHVVAVPIGFLCDHVEVLFDLDVEAKATAKRLGLGFGRASTVRDHPTFIEMLASLIDKAVHADATAREVG